MSNSTRICAALCALGLVSITAGTPIAKADPINVSYTVSGSPGDWTLDFSVNNNLTSWPHQELYHFAVSIGGPITGNPPNLEFTPSSFSINPGHFEGVGPNIWYNDVWGYNYGPGYGAPPGTTISGFDVTITDAVAPTSVDWVAYLIDAADASLPIESGYNASLYFGGGNFNSGAGFDGRTPEFAGVAGPGSAADAISTPEPATLTLLGTGLAGLIALRRRKTA
jgi:PEP-CTERM motif